MSSRVSFPARGNSPGEELDPGRILEKIYDHLLYLGAIMTSGMMRLAGNRERETRQRINTGFSLDQTSERQRRKEMNVLRHAF